MQTRITPIISEAPLDVGRSITVLGLNGSTGWFDLAAPDRIVVRADFHRPSRAAGPRQQLRKSSSAASHFP
jgi:hypothetical protein